MIDYSEPLIAIKQELKYLEDAPLHGKLVKVPQILYNIENESDKLKVWLMTKNIDV